MRKHFITLLLVMLSVVTFGQQWVAIKSDNPSTIQTTLVSSSENQITVNLQVPGFHAIEVATPRGAANIISVPRTVSTAQAGEPNLPMIAIPAIIGDQQHYSIRLIDAQYVDFQMEVAPSKGDFPRTVNPEDVPYTYSEAYAMDAFFPTQNLGLYEPYILRDFRGQNMVVYPFAYNPVTHTLRVYYNMTIEMFSDGLAGENTFSRRSSELRMDPEFGALYQNHFINYNESLSKYAPIDETGELLIICHDDFMEAMQPFVNWKKQIGRPTTMVGTSTSGSTSDALKTYIQTQYDDNPNISHILLVGDNAQIQGYYAYNGGYTGRSDNWYGQLVGNDYYNDVIVGRFSAETTNHVTTQVNKVIHYERDIDASDTWLSTGQGISKNEGAGSGHFGEADYQHIDFIRDTLLHYNYTNIHRDYQGVTGVTSSAAIISQHINQGVSIINYCNHGSATSWGVFSYTNSHVNSLTNDNKLPIIWSVACNNGQLDYSSPCFAETWLRARNNNTGEPTGAIGGMFSYISQPWQPPMYGQDEMVNVLTENRNSIKRTLGGASFDGNMKIIDQYGTNSSPAMGTYMTWILFGDPTLTLRNATPVDMGVTHSASMATSATSFIVNATNGNGALATLTLDNEIMGSATITNGTANITFTAPGASGTATLTVLGYNKITYVGTVNITSGGTQSYTVNVSANPEEGGTVTGGGTFNQGVSCTVTATANEGYDFINWTENGTEVSTNASYTFNVTGNRTLVANFEEQVVETYTITATANPTNGGTVTGGGTFNQGESCTLTATPATGYNFVRWTKNGTQVSTNPSYTFTVTESAAFEAHFEAQSFTITATADPTEGGTVTGGGTYNYNASCTLRATPATGYSFVRWTKDGTEVGTSPRYTFTVTESAAFVAHFEEFDCEAPTNVTANAIFFTDIFVNWDAVPTAHAYDIYRNGTRIAFNYPYVGEYYDTGLPYGEYCYTIVAKCSLGDSDPSEEACATLNIPCNSPANFTAEYVYENESDFGVKLRWNSVALISPEYFHLYRQRDTDEYELIGDIEPEGSYNYYFDDTEIGSYSYMLTAEYHFDGQICVSEPVYASCEVTSITELNVAAKVYPNPTKGEVTLEGEGLCHVRIVNAFGQTVYNAKVENDQVRIDLSPMAKGIYMMHIEAEGGQAVRKIVVE